MVTRLEYLRIDGKVGKLKKGSARNSVSIVIVSGKKENKTLQSLRNLPEGSEVIVSTKQGLGFARNYGASQCHNDLMVQLDDDLQVKPSLWRWVQNLKVGEFAMGTVDGVNPATRVFAIYLQDFVAVGGFDNSFRYVYEDWDFFRRATKQELEFRPVPVNLYTHIDHPNRTQGPKRFKIAWECAKFWAKYPSYTDDLLGKRGIYYNSVSLFIFPLRALDFRIFLVRFFGALYWLGVWRKR
jgi:glycosyltransferase involved in cell wall biosynthesis